MQLNLTCRSFRRTSNNNSKEEAEVPQVRDIAAKERALKEYKVNGISTSRTRYHIEHKRSSKIKKIMTKLPNKVRGLGHTLVMWHC